MHDTQSIGVITLIYNSKTYGIINNKYKINDTKVCVFFLKLSDSFWHSPLLLISIKGFDIMKESLSVSENPLKSTDKLLITSRTVITVKERDIRSRTG